MYLLKSRKQKMAEYEIDYAHIPHDYRERLQWLYETLQIDDQISDQILTARDAYIASTYWKTIRLVMYEIPEFQPRPRAQLITRKNIINSVGTNGFIHIYTENSRDNKGYMELYKQENLPELVQLLCTPCDIEMRYYYPTPKQYNKVQIFLAEIGLDRPIMKPDIDNTCKAYFDMFTDNIWLDDILVNDVLLRRYFSVLPRVEIDLKYANQLYNIHQYKNMIKRKDFPDGMNVDYFY